MKLTKAQAAKRVAEAKTKIKKVYYEFSMPITSAQNRKIIDTISMLDSLESMFRKL